MPLLLLETSTTACSVCLAQDGRLLAEREINEGYAHSENITVFIDEVFREAGLAMADLDAVVVSSGPGSYTGLRIGVSTAKGICYALDKPLIAVSTLKAMAAGYVSRSKDRQKDVFVPMIDARRMEVYCAAFNGELDVLEPVSAKMIDADSFSTHLANGAVHFFGDGAKKCQGIIQHEHAVFAGDFSPSARYMIPLAMEKQVRKEFEDLALFEPFYLKDFVPGGTQKNY